MAELTLQAGDDHVERLAHEGDPARAVVELIWNAIDAEAPKVIVELSRNESDAITRVAVSDDGHGISLDEVEPTFGRIGGSWKLFAAKTRNGMRRLHGKQGVGRLRAFALGSEVEWLSHSFDTAGRFNRLRITGTTARRQTFEWESEITTGVPTGTVVTAWNRAQRSLAPLEPVNALPVLLADFAPVLLSDDQLKITYSGKTLDPSDAIRSQTESTIEFGTGGRKHQAQLRIIEWKAGRHRSLHFGPDAQHFVHEESAKELEPQFSYSAYVAWDGLDQTKIAQLGLGEMDDGDVGALVKAGREAIRHHFETRRQDRRRQQVAKWKQDQVYPFEGSPKNEADRAERLLFDAVAGTVSAQISSRKQDAKLTLALMRDALRHDPGRLTTIVREVVALNDDDRDTLTRLLGETTLPAIIRTADIVASRHKFLQGLEHLLFDPDDSDKIGERDHLHRLLERELWIFGERYHLMSSERGLTEMLRTHLKLEALPIRPIQPVKRWDQRSGRTDLHLAAKSNEFGQIHHLVVELKAPGIILGRAELNQVEDYANVVLSNAAFASDLAMWDFILVGTGWDDVVANRLTPDTRALGQFLAPEHKTGRPRVRAFVRRWRDVLDENKQRLAFMTNSMEHDPSIAEGLAHIRELYAAFLPADLSSDEQRTLEDASEPALPLAMNE